MAPLHRKSEFRPFSRLASRVVAALGLALLVGACGEYSTAVVPPAREVAVEPPPPDTCPATALAPRPLGGIAAEEETLGYWTSLWGAAADEPLLTAEGARDLNRSLATLAPEFRQVDLREVTAEGAAAELDERVVFLRSQLTDRYVAADGARFDAGAIDRFLVKPPLAPEPIRVALAPAPVRCAATADSFFVAPVDVRFDRNNCSMLRAQDPVVVLGRVQGLLLVRAAYTLGWIADTAPLSAALSADDFGATYAGDRFVVREPLTVDGVALPAGTLLGKSASGAPWVATAAGGVELPEAKRAAVDSTASEWTRRSFFAAAMARVGEPYGWGDEGGHLDCSRFVMDIAAELGVRLPRFSGAQAQTGSYRIPLADITDTRERLRLLDAAFERGIVLLPMPGHIMMYLGRNAAGEPRVLHSFAEYVAPCAEPDAQNAETLFLVDRVSVSGLDVGAGTSRRSYLERIDHVVVLGGTPGPRLLGDATLRAPAPVAAPAACETADDVQLLVSPRRPTTDQRLTIVVTSSRELWPLDLSLTDTAGRRIEARAELRGGPPYAAIFRVDAPPAGDLRVVVGDGARVEACTDVTVRTTRPPPPTGSGAVWPVRNEWDRNFENLYATFVESLFAYPVDEDLTWTNLHDILANPDRNLLFDYFGQREELEFKLEPDCADLPYMVRGYFAWKLGLPFGYSRCNRGRSGSPPSCGAAMHNLAPRAAASDLDAFELFINREVRNAVHSATGRTPPEAELTDVYPVALTRESLLPGTTYSDPYGHVMMVVGWVPQRASSYGILLAADAQPDKTIGRRRFWRGTFLFVPETTDVGAGFKAWRPLVRDRRTDGLRPLTNDELTDSRQFAPFSLKQYAGTQDDFYDAMDGVINPRPMDPWSVMDSLIDALLESVVRRVNSVDNGEQYMRSTGYRPIDMPTGYAVFETSGPWEDYSTPSRDMRLLIAIDAVLDFPDSLLRRPEHFGVAASEATQTAEALRGYLREQLAAQTFVYHRTDASEWTLSLAEVVDRGAAFEVTYNPNDCAERRWGAPEGTPEFAPCNRSAPASQQALMERYREWFSERRRPPR